MVYANVRIIGVYIKLVETMTTFKPLLSIRNQQFCFYRVKMIRYNKYRNAKDLQPRITVLQCSYLEQ